MTTRLDPNQVTRLLTQGTRQLDASILSVLSDARRNALNRQSARSPVLALTSGGWTHNLIPHSAQQWAITAMLAVMLVIGGSYLQHSQEQQINDLDVAILTDELPIEVFVD